MSGYMTFVDTEVLDAAQVNGYLMSQVVARFTTAAERDAELIDPDENQLCFVVGAGLQIFDSGAWAPFAMVTTVAGRAGDVVLVKADVGLGNVDNTSDATKNAAAVTLTNKTLTAPVVNAPTGIVKADVGLSDVDNTSDVNKPVSTAQAAADTAAKARANHTGTQLAATVSDFSAAADARITAQKGAASGLAPLDSSSKIAATYLPAIAITSTFVVASQAAQLALTAQEGDVAVRSDLNQSFINNGGVTGTMADWTLLATPTDAVLSVSGRTGVVVLVKGDVGLGNVDNTADAAKPVSTAQQTALDLKAPLASPAFTGTPTFPAGSIAATALAAIPESGVTNLTTDLAAKAPLASPTFTGTATAAAVTATGLVTISRNATTQSLAIVNPHATGDGIQVQLGTATRTVLMSNITGDATQRFTMDANGKMVWGAGALAGDANLYRFIAGQLKTDGVLRTGGGILSGDYLNTTNDISAGTSLAVGTSAVIGTSLKVNGSVGFYGTAPVGKGTVAGSRGGNAALASLLTMLATCGLLNDTTTA